MMKARDRALAIAKKRGYVAVDRFAEWGGFEVFECLWSTDEDAEVPDVGLPEFALANDTEARFTEPDEAFAILDALPEE